MHDTILSQPRVAIYARYSSNLQKPTSIEDQVRLCEERAESLGGVIVGVHSDFEASAATGRFQPGLDALLLDAKRGYMDIVFAEALDRISRDQEHIHGIHKRLLFWKVRLFTLHEGEIQPIHISIGGYVNSAYIENLKAKTRRGQIGAVKAGRVPGGLSYGFEILAHRLRVALAAVQIPGEVQARVVAGPLADRKDAPACSDRLLEQGRGGGPERVVEGGLVQQTHDALEGVVRVHASSSHRVVPTVRTGSRVAGERLIPRRRSSGHT